MKTRNALTVDVEDYFQVSAFDGVVARDTWHERPSRVEANTRRLLDLFDNAGARATFFVLGWIAERFPGLVPEIAGRGHEIACHGYGHRLVYTQTPAEFRGETDRAKRVLEDQAGVSVAGYRAASYSITHASLWALDVLVDLGFRYDSSIFPVRHDRYGIPGSPRWPHQRRTPRGRALLEFPLTTWRIGGVDVPVAGGGYFRIYPYALTRHALRHVNRVDGQPFVFYLHPWEIDPGQPRIAASWRSRFRHYTGLARCEPRLRRLLDEFEFTTVADCLENRPGASVPGTEAVIGG